MMFTFLFSSILSSYKIYLLDFRIFIKSQHSQFWSKKLVEVVLFNFWTLIPWLLFSSLINPPYILSSRLVAGQTNAL